MFNESTFNSSTFNWNTPPPKIKYSFKKAAIEVLKTSDKALSFKEITEIAIEKWYLVSKWKTPEATMSALIYTDIKNYWDKSYYKRDWKNKFILNPDSRPEKFINKKITLKWFYSQSALWWTFRVIRWFADLRDLSNLSFSYDEYQRDLIPEHAEDIVNFFVNWKYKFIPEIILSLRVDKDLTWISLKKGFSKEQTAQIIDPEGFMAEDWFWSKPEEILGNEVEIELDPLVLEQEENKLRRIDWNHRLSLADNLTDDPNSPNKYIIPFCIILLWDKSKDYDDEADAMIFHNINSKNIPITSEHSINVILNLKKDDLQSLFDEDKILYATKIFADNLFWRKDKDLIKLLWKEPLTRIYQIIKFLFENNIIVFSDRRDLDTEITSYFNNFHTIFCWAKTEWLKLCDYFEIIPAILLVCYKETIQIKRNQIIKDYSNWLETNNLWTNFPKMEYVLFDIFWTIKNWLSLQNIWNTPFVSPQRIQELNNISNTNFDTKKLVRLCEELNMAYQNGMYYSCWVIQRAILDHIPPIFLTTQNPTFAQFAASVGRSHKSIFERLENSCRDVADNIVHSHIKRRESLPTQTQINFSQDLDVLLGEVINKLSL